MKLSLFLRRGKTLRQLIQGSMGLLLITLMVNCAQATTKPPEITSVNGANVLDGPNTAAYLSTLYNRNFGNCHRSESQPAFLCSGVTFKPTIKDPAERYKVWDPRPASIANGGVSFSYLRIDTNFNAFENGNHNGYILYPFLEAPAGKTQLFYMCSYPMDARSLLRSPVCGPYHLYPHHSNLCQYHNVTIAEQWVYVWTYPDPNAVTALQQCGFDVSDDRNVLAGPAFRESLRSRNLLAAVSANYAAQVFNERNEIIIQTWTPGQPNTFPILAFFYVAGYPQGLADAQYNQRDFYNSTNPRIVVPIIRLTPAASLNGTAAFTYSTADQVVTP